MTDARTIFNDTGKIPTDSDFWAQDIEWANEMGFTKYFSKVLGEQIFAPLKKPQLAFYNAFAGRPITSGKGWTERILKKSVTKKFKPNADAADDLKFYESGGYEYYFGVNTGGWKPVSLPSDLETIEEMLKSEGVGQLNNLLVDNVVLDYQRDVESEIQMKSITCCKNSVDVNPTDYIGLIKKINALAIEMKGTTKHYNDVTTYRDTGEIINDYIYTNSDEVLVFIYEGLLANIRESLGGLPSPEKLGFEGVRIIPLVDPLPKPLTTVEWTAGQSTQGWDSNIEPSNLDGPAPLVYMCSAKRCEYRPLVGGYKMNMSKNGAGDFTNVHAIWKAALILRPWENAIVINGDDSITDVTPAINVKVIEEPEPRVVHSITYEVNPELPGLTCSGPSEAEPGESITAVASSCDPEWIFQKFWSPDVEISEELGTFTMPDKDVRVVAYFQSIGHNVTTIATPTGDGSLSADPSVGVEQGTTVQLTTTPALGRFLDRFEAEGIEASDIMFEKFTMPNDDVTVRAVFSDVSPGDATPEILITADDGTEFEATDTDTSVPDPLVCGGLNRFTTGDTVEVDGKSYLFDKWVIDGHEFKQRVLDFLIEPRYVGEAVPVDVNYLREYVAWFDIPDISPDPQEAGTMFVGYRNHLDLSSIAPEGKVIDEITEESDCITTTIDPEHPNAFLIEMVSAPTNADETVRITITFKEA